MDTKPMKIAVLMGGTSFEREFSLESGHNVTRQLESLGHTVLPLDITPTLVQTLREQMPDVAYIALHGKTGEDGTIESLLEFLNIPFVGSGSGVCRLTWNKSVLPYAVRAYCLSQHLSEESPEVPLEVPKEASITPPVLTETLDFPEVFVLPAGGFKDMGLATALDLVGTRMGSTSKLAVKPACGGSAMGVACVTSQDELALALLDALSYDDEVLVERWIDGVELAVTVLGSGSEAYALSPVEIVAKRGFFDTDARLDSELVDYYCPPRLASLSVDGDIKNYEQTIESIKAAAVTVHRASGCRDISRVDMIWSASKVGSKAVSKAVNKAAGDATNKIVTEAVEEVAEEAVEKTGKTEKATEAKTAGKAVEKKAYVLEINTSPGMTEHSLVPMACEAEGIKLAALLDKMLREAATRQKATS